MKEIKNLTDWQENTNNTDISEADWLALQELVNKLKLESYQSGVRDSKNIVELSFEERASAAKHCNLIYKINELLNKTPENI